MNKYEIYNPNIEGNPTDSETDSLTYSDINEGTPDDHKKPSRQSRRQGKGNNKQSRKQKSRSTKKPSVSEVSIFERVRTFVESPQTKFMVGITSSLIAAYIIIAFISFVKDGFADQSSVNFLPQGAASGVVNMAGEGGARLSQFLINDTFGLGSLVIICWLVGVALKQFGILKFKIVNFTIKCIVALLTTSLIVGLMTIAVDAHFLWGGAHGYAVNLLIKNYLGWTGAAFLCIFMLALFFVICLNDIYQYFMRIRRRKKAERDAKIEAEMAEEERRRTIASMQNLEEESSADTAAEEAGDPDGMVFSPDENPLGFQEYDATGDLNEITTPDADENPMDAFEDEYPQEADDEYAETESEEAESDDSTEGSSTEITAPSGDTLTVNVNDISQAVDDDEHPNIYDPTAELSHYKFPPYNLLREASAKISVDQDEQLENQEKIRATLLDFGIAITSITATVGPTVTLYEIKPEKGIKIAKIRNLGDDIALSLSAIGVRIIAPIPGKGTVGIEVANKDPQTVSMRTIVTSREYQECKYELPVAIGSTINNRVYIADLAKMPHLLVAGATGQGKSVGLNAIIASLLYRKHPSELKFVLIDPKMVEFSLYKDLERHYLAMLPGEEEPIITNPEKVVATLSSLCVEMDDRYNLLKMAHVRNIKEYNAKFITKVLNPNDGHRFLPYIVVVVDEFSDLIMTAGKEVELPIARLAQKARAVGIHVIIATQRPSTNVITGIIKANFPARIAFKVSSGVDSKTILDTTGAQQLIGRGDMLILTSSEMERVQCAFIDTPEVTKICEFIKSQPGYSEAYRLPEPLITGDGGDDSFDSNNFGDRDPLFDEIARVVVTSNTASTSSLQRRYSIGYNRAGKIMDQLEAAGIVGPAQGGKPRAVLVDPIGLENILNSI